MEVAASIERTSLSKLAALLEASQRIVAAMVAVPVVGILGEVAMPEADDIPDVEVGSEFHNSFSYVSRILF